MEFTPCPLALSEKWTRTRIALSNFNNPPLAEFEIVTSIPIASKKNSANFGWVNGRPVFIGNPAFNRMRAPIAEELRARWVGRDPLEGPLAIALEIQVKNESWAKEWPSSPSSYSGTDIDNKVCSVFDILKEAQVVQDDCQFVALSAVKILGKAKGEDGYVTRIRLLRHEWPS